MLTFWPFGSPICFTYAIHALGRGKFVPISQHIFSKLDGIEYLVFPQKKNNLSPNQPIITSTSPLWNPATPPPLRSATSSRQTIVLEPCFHQRHKFVSLSLIISSNPWRVANPFRPAERERERYDKIVRSRLLDQKGGVKGFRRFRVVIYFRWACAASHENTKRSIRFSLHKDCPASRRIVAAN